MLRAFLALAFLCLTFVGGPVDASSGAGGHAAHGGPAAAVARDPATHLAALPCEKDCGHSDQGDCLCPAACVTAGLCSPPRLPFVTTGPLAGPDGMTSGQPIRYVPPTPPPRG